MSESLLILCVLGAVHGKTSVDGVAFGDGGMTSADVNGTGLVGCCITG